MYPTSAAFLLLLTGLLTASISSPSQVSPTEPSLEIDNETAPPNVSVEPGNEGATESRQDANPDLRSLPFGKADTKNIGKYGAPGSAHYFPDPTRSSGVLVFFDDGAGTSIGVVATESNWQQFGNKGWEPHNRFWQESDWCRDVTGFAWSEDGRYLFVATCDIYGTGKMYQLDLHRRKVATIFPVAAESALDGHCRSCSIDAIGKDGITVYVRDYCDNDTIFVRRTLPFLGSSDFAKVPEK